MMPLKGARISVRPLWAAASESSARAFLSLASESLSSFWETIFWSARSFVLSYSISVRSVSACAFCTSAW